MAAAAASRRGVVYTGRRLFSSSSIATGKNNHKETHNFLEANSFLGCWEAPKNPKEAEKRLAMLRRQYAKQLKEVRKEYIVEMEAMRMEKQRKDEARQEVIRIANEERRKLKAEAAKVRAEERKVAEEEFRQTLLKERTEKLENWRMKEAKREEKKNAAKELLRRSSSQWVDEEKLEGQIIEVLSGPWSF
ncbi:unnamed protein product [Linum tenue]|uniref:Stress response NST1-like protein n=1 Tax=Linum tenue TaxID=586396 RepID=A0AAV0IXU6_9ROSI|nr:unnamed protein product [Linum tenue]